VRRALICIAAAACSGDAPTGEPEVACGDGMREEFENCDDGNRVAGDGCDTFCQPEPLVTVTWAFFPTLDGPATATGCRAGVSQVELVTEVDTSARLPCDDRRTGGLFVPMTKQVFARLRGPDDVIIAESLPVRPNSNARADAAFYEDAGYIRASLPIQGSCGGAITLTLIDAAQVATNYPLPCKDGDRLTLVTSGPIRAGTYFVRFRNPFGEQFDRADVVGSELLMRALVLVATLAACDGDSSDIVCGDGVAESFEQCDDGNRIGGDGCDPTRQPEQGKHVIWAFYPTIHGPEQPGCRPGVTEIEIVTSTAPTSYRYPCDNNRLAAVFVQGQALVLARLRDANNDIIAEALPQRAVGASLWMPFYEDAGYLLVLAKSCSMWIDLVTTPTGGTPTMQRLNCAGGPVERLYSKPLEAGTYEVQLTGAAVDTRTVEIGANNRVTELSLLD
jgi:cysteine-rich repeat protein